MKPIRPLDSTVTLVVALTLGVAGGSACADLLNIANWNIANNPDTAGEIADLATVLGHIGTVGGRPLDVLAMMEADTAGVALTLSTAQSVYGSSNYALVASTPDGGSDRTGFVYNTSTLNLLGSVELSDGLTHNIIRAHFQPVGGVADTDFYLYSVHLKSGDSTHPVTGDRAIRAAEAQVLRADADALGEGANVVFVGDFNWSGADERGPVGISAYEVFDAPGAGRTSDAVNAVGDWRDEPAFLSLHTQDPRTTMNDRFDMQLISDELRDGVGIDVLPDGYRVIGNNGTHLLNENILTGTGAPADVLSALFRFSDHLPVLASYTYAVPEPATLGGILAASVLGSRRRRRVVAA